MFEHAKQELHICQMYTVPRIVPHEKVFRIITYKTVESKLRRAMLLSVTKPNHNTQPRSYTSAHTTIHFTEVCAMINPIDTTVIPKDPAIELQRAAA